MLRNSSKALQPCSFHSRCSQVGACRNFWWPLDLWKSYVRHGWPEMLGWRPLQWRLLFWGPSMAPMTMASKAICVIARSWILIEFGQSFHFGLRVLSLRGVQVRNIHRTYWHVAIWTFACLQPFHDTVGFQACAISSTQKQVGSRRQVGRPLAVCQPHHERFVTKPLLGNMC